jgi:hypothetical protein
MLGAIVDLQTFNASVGYQMLMNKTIVADLQRLGWGCWVAPHLHARPPQARRENMGSPRDEAGSSALHESAHSIPDYQSLIQEILMLIFRCVHGLNSMGVDGDPLRTCTMD